MLALGVVDVAGFLEAVVNHFNVTNTTQYATALFFAQRLQKFKRGVREWRWVRCRPVTYIIDILLSIHSKRDAGFHLMKTNRTMKTLTIFFGKWSGVCRQNAPMRRAVKKAAEAKIYEKKLVLLRRVSLCMV